MESTPGAQPDRSPLRRRLLRGVPRQRASRPRSRPHEGGGIHRHPRRRVGVVDMGAARRRVRPGVAPAGPRRCACSRHPSDSRHPDLRGAAVAAGRAPRDRGGTHDRASGSPWGARQEIDFSHPVFRVHAERVIRAILDRHARHPAVIGFQVDNEPGLELFHNEHVFQEFRRSAGAASTATSEALNDEWGLTYWSHRIS